VRAARLERLTIEDVGLIESADIDLAPGLTVVTGETGSGKTMLLGALALALGERLVGSPVRQGASRARVTLTLRGDAALESQLEEIGAPIDPGEDIVLLRDISAQGRSNARINACAVPAGHLRDLAAQVIERVGQHDQQRLLDPAAHRELLDRFGGVSLAAALTALRGAVSERDSIEERARRWEEEHHRRETTLREAEALLEEIRLVDPQPDEDRTLREQRERIIHAERILAGLRLAHDALIDEEGSALHHLGRALTALRQVESYGTDFAELGERLLATQVELSDQAATIARLVESLPEASIEEQDRIGDRLARIERLKRRVGGDLTAVRLAEEEARLLLEQTGDENERRQAFRRDLARLEEEIDRHHRLLQAERRRAAERLERSVAAELTGLAMPAARIVVCFERLDRIGADGGERVTFALSVGHGQAPVPLTRGASGGELSRILLALVVTLAGELGVGCYLFDEIDSGIGGATATAVGERLARLTASGAQVIAVTHLAQIAAYADAQIVVSKEAGQVRVRALTTPAERLAEVARMLSGSEANVAREHAAHLLDEAAARLTRSR